MARIALLFLFLTSCMPPAVRYIQQTDTFANHHTGFYLYDPEAGKVLADMNGKKYFIPASNTKIFTFYASLRLLPERIPALTYRESEDSLIFWGTGDPSFLNSTLPDNGVYGFLKQAKKPLYFSTSNFHDDPLGPGWAWDDFSYAYQAEKAPFPMYGNLIHFEGKQDSAWQVEPAFFNTYLVPGEGDFEGIRRDVRTNRITYGFQPGEEINRNVPIRMSTEAVVSMLSDTLSLSVTAINAMKNGSEQTLYGTPSDSVYQRMMQVSDNFIAEQLMLMNAGMLRDSLQTSIAISYVKDSLLTDLPNEPIWRDGSGLSRYNLFTPESIVRLWEKIYKEVEQDRLFALLPAGGVSGTLENYYHMEPPYIYGKTGTLSNNHSLSGFLITKKGKTLIFSFMNNNYRYGSSTVKVEMERILKDVYEKY